MRLPIAATLIACLPLPAFAASVSGTITGPGGGGLNGIEVRLWNETPKGFVILAPVRSDPSGNYTFADVEPGNYKVDARMGSGVDGNYADRWYDVAPPTSNGYTPDAADVLVVGEDDLVDIDIALESTGGFDGFATLSGVLSPSVQVRAERRDEGRIHHNTISQGSPHLGLTSFRGLAKGDYRILAHHPSGQYEDLLAVGPFNVNTGNMQLPDGTINLVPAAEDPREASGGNDTSGATNIDVTPLHRDVPADIVIDDARIAPAADLDFYCFDARKGDRLLISMTASFIVPDRENPWMDPFLQVYSGNGTTKLFEDDDGGPGGRDALIDTGMIEKDGRICVVASAFGLQNGGAYELVISMGNRAPSLSVTRGGMPVDPAPAMISINESEMLELDVTFSDPEGGNTVTASVIHTGATGEPVEGGLLTRLGDTASYSWSADEMAARQSPYTVRFEVTDGEFVRSFDVLVEVVAINQMPEPPTLLSPEDQTVVNTTTPGLTIANGSDLDGDVLRYEFQLTYGDAATPAQTVLVDEGTEGQTTFTPEAIPENTVVHWTARTYDGNEMDAYSEPAGPFTFLVDTANDPPTVPTIAKPSDGEVQILRRPTLSADNPVDPEGDPVVLIFQVARDASFAEVVVESPAVPMETTSTTTPWTLDEDLDWGTSYFARVKARDDRDGESAYSEPIAFGIKENALPTSVTLGGDFAEQCSNLVVAAAPGELELRNATDGDNEPVSIEIRIVPYDQDPENGTPLFQTTVVQAAGSTITVVDLSGVAFVEDRRYRVRARATDGSGTSEWVECSLTVDAKRSTANKADGGCGCGAGEGSSALALLVLALLRRRAA